MCLGLQPRPLVDVSGVHCHARASSASGCAFVHFTVQFCIEFRGQCLYFTPRMSASKRDRSGDVAGPPALSRVLYSKSNDVPFIVSVCLCVICVKSIVNLFLCSTV